MPAGGGVLRQPGGLQGGRAGCLAPVGTRALFPACGQAQVLLGPALQHAARIPVHAILQQRLRLLQHGAHAAARYARENVVVRGEMRGEQTHRQSGGPRRRCIAHVQHLHLPAAPRQAGCRGGARQTCANHQAAGRCSAHGAGRGRARSARLPPRIEGGLQVVALGRHARHLLYMEAALRERIAHCARNGPGGQARAPAAAARHGLERVQVPEVRIALRAESVQIDRIHGPFLLAQHRLRVANAECQQHAPAIKGEAVHARQQPPELVVQFLGQRRKFRVGRGSAQQVSGTDGPGLCRDEVQQAGALRIGPPRRPGDQKIQPEAEPGFENAPLGTPSPCRRQAAAVQENLVRLIQPTVFTVITVAEAGAVRGAVREPVNGFGHEER